jgi:hypothetical protein
MRLTNDRAAETLGQKPSPWWIKTSGPSVSYRYESRLLVKKPMDLRDVADVLAATPVSGAKSRIRKLAHCQKKGHGRSIDFACHFSFDCAVHQHSSYAGGQHSVGTVQILRF